MSYKFCFDEKRTRRSTHEMILMMAKHGNHSYHGRFVSDAEVKRFFQSNGCYWADLVQRCRKPSELVPLVENLIGSTWVAPQGGVSIVGKATTDEEKKIASLEGPGILTTKTYLQLFENAVASFHRCMEKASFGDFQSCVSNGIASIDAYIMHRAWIYNSTHPTELLVDSKEDKVSQDTKIDEWIPKMSGGKRLDKSGIRWSHFRKLRAFRDQGAIHVNVPASSISFQDLGELLNSFRYGIAGLRIDLHMVFGERIPCAIIRYAYLPDAKLVETQPQPTDSSHHL